MDAVEIFRGDTWVRVWTITVGETPLDLTGATARLQVRTKAADEKVWLDVSEQDGLTIVEPPISGVIMLEVQTEDLPVGKYYFDLEITLASGRKKTYEQNMLIVKQDVTR